MQVRQINLKQVMLILGLPVITLGLGWWYVATYSFSWYLVGVFAVWHSLLNLAFGAGYHRCWTHRAGQLNPVVEVIFALLGAAGGHGSVWQWATHHLNHHKYADTTEDPHSITRFNHPVANFMWAHMGWLLFQPTADLTAELPAFLKKNKILAWQHRHLTLIALMGGGALPLLAGAWLTGSWQGAVGTLLATMAAQVVHLQGAFCLNSVCHLWGQQRYVLDTSVDNLWVRLLTGGEGGHNFHHAFPSDYRSGSRWWQWDPAKWALMGLSAVGLARGLKTVPPSRELIASTRMTVNKLSPILAQAPQPEAWCNHLSMLRYGLIHAARTQEERGHTSATCAGYARAWCNWQAAIRKVRLRQWHNLVPVVNPGFGKNKPTKPRRAA